MQAGLVRGPVAGMLPGLSTTVGTSVPTDGPDGWYLPQSADDFTALGLNTPDVMYLCDESSGNLVPTIDGLSAGNLVVQGTGHLYQQSIAGWSSPFVELDGTAGAGWFTTSAALNVSAGESYAMIVMGAVANTVTLENLFLVQGTSDRVLMTAGGFVQTRHNSLFTDGVSSPLDNGLVMQFGWYRRADANVSGCETNVESIVAGTHDESARSGLAKGIGAPSPSGACANFQVNRIMVFKGSNAEFDMQAYLSTLRG